MNNLDDNIKKLHRHLSIIKEKGVKNNINGKSKNSVSGKKFPNYSPVDETFICDVEKSNSQDVDAAASSSKEAFLDDDKPEIVYMKNVNAIFYFKDDTILYLWANKGIYNNKNLDMKFEVNVKAEYLNSNLFADKAEYSNSENYLSIYGNVKVDDIQGNLIADKLIFDITKQKLDITSFNNGKINAQVNLDEKRF